MQLHEQYLATQYTRVVWYPPLGSLACLLLFIFFDQVINYSHVSFLVTEPIPVLPPASHQERRKTRMTRRKRRLTGTRLQKKSQNVKKGSTRPPLKESSRLRRVERLLWQTLSLYLLLLPRRFLRSLRKERPMYIPFITLLTSQIFLHNQIINL